ncbi:MAG: hypothetical protein KGL39_37140 [Patescibacteria group bacterium]|nr:hypothetical protein [Patescibacteria group bacterium]
MADELTPIELIACLDMLAAEVQRLRATAISLADADWRLAQDELVHERSIAVRAETERHVIRARRLRGGAA